MSDVKSLTGMVSVLPHHHYGGFVWHELMTPDVAAAQAFYGQLFGWTFETVASAGIAYHMIKLGDQAIGGLFTRDQLDGWSVWIGAVSVPDVDTAAARVAKLGGRIMLPPTDVVGNGRLATLADPQGAVFSLFHSPGGDPIEPETPAIGTFCWNHLATPDVAAVGTFYSEVIGWKLVDAPTAPKKQAFVMCEIQEAGCIQAPPGQEAEWVAHVYVDSVSSSLHQAKALGATTRSDKLDVWGPWTYATLTDPTGATLSLFGRP